MSDDICWASYTKDIRLVRKLLSEGAAVESRDRDNRTPLLNAVSGDNIGIELVQLLLDANADVNCQDSAGFTALHFCAQNKLPDIARLLIDKGADVNLKDQWGNTPLFRGLGKAPENQQLIELFMSSNVDPYSKNNSGVSVMDHVLRLKSHSNHEYFKALHESRS